MRRWLAVVVLLAAPVVAQTRSSLHPPTTTVAGLPANDASATEGFVRLYIVTDGADATDCTVGGGSTRVICWDDGTNWVAVGSGGGGVSDHGALTGLSDDDHTQYVLVDGTRALTDYLDFDEASTPTDPPADTLRLWALDAGGFGQLHFRNSSGLDYQLARDALHTVRNVSGSTLTKGTWVYITGSSGVFPTVDAAKADSSSTAPAVGIVVADIANNSFGQIVSHGDVKNIDTSAFVDGDELWLSAATAGLATTTEPTGTDISQLLGVVVKGASVGAGSIAVFIGGEFDPTSTQTFQNKSFALGDNTLTGTLAQLNTALGTSIADGAHTTDTGPVPDCAAEEVQLGDGTCLLHNLDATAAPAVTDDSGSGYAPGSVWVDVTADKAYVCLDASVGAAVWTETTQSGAASSGTGLQYGDGSGGFSEVIGSSVSGGDVNVEGEVSVDADGGGTPEITLTHAAGATSQGALLSATDSLVLYHTSVLSSNEIGRFSSAFGNQFKSVVVAGGADTGDPELWISSSATQPGHTFFSDSDLGMGRAGADQLSLIAGGGEVVNVTNDGTDHTLTVKGSATQAGNLFVVEDSGSNQLLAVDASGDVVSDADSVTVTRFGVDALAANDVAGGGVNNTASGYRALFSNTTGLNNTASGWQALFSNTTGNSNTASGVQALYANTTGANNTASGFRSLFSNKTGSSNTANGLHALYNNTAGIRNTASGYEALFNNTTGSTNTALGSDAGRWISGGVTANQTSGTSVYLGASTKALADGDANEIVIGYNTTGNGSNTATLGNASVTDVYAAEDSGATVHVGALQIHDPGTQPTCDATTRGTQWVEEGAAGVADVLSVCLKGSDDLYTWVTIATG